jgi:hypothetical protein
MSATVVNAYQPGNYVRLRSLPLMLAACVLAAIPVGWLAHYAQIRLVSLVPATFYGLLIMLALSFALCCALAVPLGYVTVWTGLLSGTASDTVAALLGALSGAAAAAAFALTRYYDIPNEAFDTRLDIIWVSIVSVVLVLSSLISALYVRGSRPFCYTCGKLMKRKKVLKADHVDKDTAVALLNARTFGDIMALSANPFGGSTGACDTIVLDHCVTCGDGYLSLSRSTTSTRYDRRGETKTEFNTTLLYSSRLKKQEVEMVLALHSA